jgi:predicted peptidase
MTALTPHSFNALPTRPVHLGYWRYLPPGYADDPAAIWPLLLFLHGFGERGDGESDLSRVLLHGPPRRIQAGADYPCIVIAPQCPADSWWTFELDALAALLDALLVDLRVDRARVYCTGLSMGGYGTWAMGMRYGARFAALAPVCGGGVPPMAALLKAIPVWAFHGDADTVVPVSESQEMVDALRAAGGDVRLTIYPGVGHDSWTPAYDDPALLAWLLAH